MDLFVLDRNTRKHSTTLKKKKEKKKELSLV